MFAGRWRSSADSWLPDKNKIQPIRDERKKICTPRETRGESAAGGRLIKVNKRPRAVSERTGASPTLGATRSSDECVSGADGGAAARAPRSIGGCQGQGHKLTLNSALLPIRVIHFALCLCRCDHAAYLQLSQRLDRHRRRRNRRRGLRAARHHAGREAGSFFQQQRESLFVAPRLGLHLIN
jgi:hypothetical protein